MSIRKRDINAGLYNAYTCAIECSRSASMGPDLMLSIKINNKVNILISVFVIITLFLLIIGYKRLYSSFE